jgi:hypothetical protein
MEANNEAHTHLYDMYIAVKAKYEELRYDSLIYCKLLTYMLVFNSSRYNSVMEDIKSAIKHPQEPSSSHGNMAPTSSSKLLSFKKDDFPDIKFWRQRDYTQYLNSKKQSRSIVDPNNAPRQRGGARLASTNENVATDYIELKDGQVVEGDKAANIRKRVRDIFKEMMSSAKMVLPKTWSEAGITERNYFLQELYKDYPYIAFCDDDWKGIFLASRTLSAFHNSLRRKVKLEVAENDEKKLKEEKEPELKESHTIDITTDSPGPILSTPHSNSHSPVKRTAPEVSREEPPSKRCRTSESSPIRSIPTGTPFTPINTTAVTAASDMDSAGTPSSPRLQVHRDKPQRKQAKNDKEREQLPQVAIETAAKAPALPLVTLVNPL